MWNIFLTGSHDSIPSSHGTGGRLLYPCIKSGQSGKENYPVALLMLPADGANTRSAARAVLDGVCRSCCKTSDASLKKKDDRIIFAFPHR
jgi:hypothetical protein